MVSLGFTATLIIRNVPILTIVADPSNGSYHRDDETTPTTDKDTFEELQAHIQKQVLQISRSQLEKSKPSHHHPDDLTESGHEHEFRLPDDASIKVDVQHEVAQALLRSVDAVKTELIRNVKRMNDDYNAAREALSIMKKLKRILDQYRRGWQDEEE